MPSKKTNSENYEVVALQISPDLGERILMSSERSVLDEIFPETNQAILDARSGVAWNQFEGHQVIRFPLNGYCKLNSIQVITRLLNSGFSLEASTGGVSGGVESQQFSEYLLVRKLNT
jgi:BTB/POZ domain-containing protein KCTD1/15